MRRVLAITGALAAVGAVAGAFSGLIAGAIFLLANVGAHDFLHTRPATFGIAAMFGAAAGVVLGPAAAWLLMRSVPIWKAIVGTAVGTIAGVLLSFAFPVPFLAQIVGGFIGFAGSALALRLKAGQRLKNASR